MGVAYFLINFETEEMREGGIHPERLASAFLSLH
jgi:hypothetical protein